MQNFWKKLPKPFFALAPLANVTDAAFRQVIAKYSKLGHPVSKFVMYTEFVSADGLCLSPEEGRQKLLRDLKYSEAERPIVAQFFTATPEHMEKAAALAQELGFDGVDINMGCPDKTIEKQGAGAKLMQTPQLATELITAAKRGAPNLPVSVKTRLGYNKDILEEWVPARWERVKRAVEIRDNLQRTTNNKTLIVGNGDLKDLADAEQKIKESGADGAMLGRAIFGNPWLFSNSYELRNIGVEKKLAIEVEHAKLFEELLGDIKNFAIMKKHFKAYVEGFPGAKELRMRLMKTTSAAEAEKVINSWLAENNPI